jgi:hypothetical protein
MTDQELQAAVRETIKRAVVDPSFRELAIRDGNAAINKTSKKGLPSGVNIQFVDNTGKPTKTIVLPDFVGTSESLSEHELEQVAGGCLITGVTS